MGKFFERLYDELSLYVRQRAWLSTAPEKPPHDKSNTPQHSRIERLRTDHKDVDYEPDMPQIDAPHIIGYLYEIGPTMSTGMGLTPISFEEILAWQSLTGIELDPWETRILRRLSYDYLSESHKAEKADYPAPWQPADLTQETRDAISKKVQNSLRSLMLVKNTP